METKRWTSALRKMMCTYIFPITPVKYNKKPWTLYTKQASEDSGRWREGKVAKDLMAQGSGKFPEVSFHLEYPITGAEEVSHRKCSQM